MEKTLFDMVIDYSVKKFPEIIKDLKKFEKMLSDSIKLKINEFKSFSTYERQKCMMFDLICENNKTVIRCETNRYYIILEANTLNEKKLKRIKNNDYEICNVLNFSIENKEKEELTSYSLTIVKENGKYALTRTKDTFNSLTLMPIREKKYQDINTSYEELENVFATLTSLEMTNKN